MQWHGSVTWANNMQLLVSTKLRQGHQLNLYGASSEPTDSVFYVADLFCSYPGNPGRLVPCLFGSSVVEQ